MTQPSPPEDNPHHSVRSDYLRNAPPAELFAERPVRSEPARSGGLSYALRRLLTVAIIIFIIGGGVYWKFHNPTPTAPGAIPTIKAEGSYKQRPEQPGGIEIPHQDVQVYQALDNNPAAKPVVEHLLPPPEEPQAPAAVQNPVPAPGAPQVENLTPLPTPTLAPVIATTVAPQPAPAPKAVAVVPVPVAAPKPQPVQAAQVQTIAPAPVAPVPTSMDQVLKDVSKAASGPAIQLASIPDQAAAEAAMEKLQTKYAATLGSAHLRLVKADLGVRGIYYRIQSQPLPVDQANAICSALKNQKAACILVSNVRP
jgi:hypothetical protein